MSIEKNCYHSGGIKDLAGNFPAFKTLYKKSIRPHKYNKWTNKKSGKVSHDFLIAFFGKSGYGKSSTVNSFIGSKIMETSDSDACTRSCNCVDYKISQGNYVSIGDFPGIGESEYRDKEYLKMYSDFMDYVGVIVYVMRADARDHSIDEDAYNNIFSTFGNQKKTIIAINQCDKVEPVSRGNFKSPTPEQMVNIKSKIEFLQKKFNPNNRIIPYSASTGWNMDVLAEEIVRVAINSGDFL